MSKGISYLAAYRLTRAKVIEQAYMQALQEIRNAEDQAKAYQSMVESLDKQILEYDKMKARLIEAKTDGTSDMDAILQAEVALAQVNQRNAANRVSVYKTADEVFDAPSRVDAMIGNKAAERTVNYSSTNIGSLKNVIATHTDVFTGLTPEQAQDAGIRYMNQVLAEDAAAGGVLASNTAELQAVRNQIASMAGVPPSKLTRSAHQDAKQTYIKGVLSTATGSTTDLKKAIKSARGQGSAAQSQEAKVLQQVAIASAADGFDDADESLLRASQLELQDSAFNGRTIKATDIKRQIKTTGETPIEAKTLVGKKYADLSDGERVVLLAARGKPTTLEELFQQRIIMSDPEVVKAKQIGDQLTTIKEQKAALTKRRTAAMGQSAVALSEARSLRDPANLRERQAEFAALAMTPEERSKYLSPEQMRRIASMERRSTTPAQRQQTKGLKLPTGMTLDDLSAFEAMQRATTAAKEGKQIPMDEVEEDTYKALSELVKGGKTAKTDIYKEALRLGNELGGLPEARRAFAQTVASRIYLDLYQEQQSSLPDAMKEVKQTLGRGATARKSPAHQEQDEIKGQGPSDEQVLQNLGNQPMDTPVKVPKRKLDEVFPETE